MDQEINNPQSGYNDPDLITAAEGDEVLLNRLVALDRAEKLMQDNPNNEGFVSLRDEMRKAVDEHQQQRKQASDPPSSV